MSILCEVVIGVSEEERSEDETVDEEDEDDEDVDDEDELRRLRLGTIAARAYTFDEEVPLLGR